MLHKLYFASYFCNRTVLIQTKFNISKNQIYYDLRNETHVLTVPEYKNLILVLLHICKFCVASVIVCEVKQLHQKYKIRGIYRVAPRHSRRLGS